MYILQWVSIAQQGFLHDDLLADELYQFTTCQNCTASFTVWIAHPFDTVHRHDLPIAVLTWGRNTLAYLDILTLHHLTPDVRLLSFLLDFAIKGIWLSKSPILFSVLLYWCYGSENDILGCREGQGVCLLVCLLEHVFLVCASKTSHLWKTANTLNLGSFWVFFWFICSNVWHWLEIFQGRDRQEDEN